MFVSCRHLWPPLTIARLLISLFNLPLTTPQHLCSQVNSGGLSWRLPHHRLPSFNLWLILSTQQHRHINTHAHTRNTPRTRKMNGSPCLYPHLWSQLRFWLVLKCCKVKGALCVCIWCWLMLSDKGLKLQFGSASMVGVVFPRRCWGLFWNLPVCTCAPAYLRFVQFGKVQKQVKQVRVSHGIGDAQTYALWFFTCKSNRSEFVTTLTHYTYRQYHIGLS